MLSKIDLPVRRAALAALVAAVAWLLAPTSSAMQVEPSEPVVWETSDGGNGHTYLFVPLRRNVSWSEANALAESMVLPDGSMGYLATIDSREEKAFIRNAVLPDDDWSNKKTAAWIGGEDEYLIVDRGRDHGHGHHGKGWWKSKGWHGHWGSGVSPEDWSYAKWRGENEPDDDRPLHRRFLTQWIKKHGHGHGHGHDDGCNDGHPSFPWPKIVGMIVEFDPPDVPEPATALLSALGLALLGLVRRR